MHPLTKPASRAMTLRAPSPHAQRAVTGAAAAGDDFRAAVMRAVDRFCGDVGGYCTADLAAYVARQPGRDSNRQHAAAVLKELCALEAIGRVRRMDDGSPIVWCKA